MEATPETPGKAFGSAVVRITVDDREAGSPVVVALGELPNISLGVERLRTGDYVVEGDCVFERKTIPDFARSLMDGRLFAQAHRLAFQASRRAFIFEGSAAEVVSTGVRREAWLGALVTLTLVYRLPVLATEDPTETARLLWYAAGQLTRCGNDVPLCHGHRPRQRRRQQLAILQSLPGVGPKRSVQLLEHFRSVAAVLGASPETLAALPGLGRVTAQRIHELVHAAPG
jgi:ERCC4-type nuclease